ncbi:hypothetical protein R3P38DRAFT_1169932 [Favolaschia claudopus]|uniref:Telomere replication protein EST3 n=1 Tax=Favolaschia claudopus TaxID=2862362 RepID=A0AAW0E0D4_9AGAR
MASELRAWVRDYLIQAAETYGSDIASVPLESKGKKLQICEFFTRECENKSEDSFVWALVSDKALIIPIKFSKEAVLECNKHSISGMRLNEMKTALVSIKKFRPISARIPLREGAMTAETHLALYCESVSIIGSIGEGRWGNPKDLEADSDLREWSHALRRDGGAANILKDRKRARDGEVGKEPRSPPIMRIPSPRKLPCVVNQAGTSKIKPKHPMDEYNKKWQDSLRNPLAFVRPATPSRPPPEDARDMGSSSPSEKYSAPSSPISGWSQSPSPQKQKEIQSSSTVEFSQRIADVSTTESSCAPQESSYLTAPTPAQRQRPAGPSTVAVERKVARPPPPPPPASGPARILAPDSDISQSQSQSQSQPSQTSQSILPPQLELPQTQTQAPMDSHPVISSSVVGMPPPTRIKKEDAEMLLSDDDAEIDRRLFRRRGSVLEREGAAKRRKHSVRSGSKLNGFSLGLDNVVAKECGGVVGWERVLHVLSAGYSQM